MVKMIDFCMNFKFFDTVFNFLPNLAHVRFEIDLKILVENLRFLKIFQHVHIS